MLLLAAVAAGFFSQQANSIEKWNTLSHTCGKIVRDVSSDKNSERLKNISNTAVQLYESNEGSSCCDGLALVEETKTTRSGDFEFHKTPPGIYWLVVRVEGRKYAMKVDYKPGYADDFGSCSDHQFTIKQSGDFMLTKYIHVD